MIKHTQKQKRVADIRMGTVIYGRLKSEDWLDAFLNELERVSGKSYPEWRLLCADDGRELSADDEEIVLDAMIDVWDRLNEYAPDGVYFGNHENDNSDYGWWPIFKSENLSDEN